MAYCTTKEFAERSGLGLRQIDENVGTGDDSETDFDLDKTNIIAGTYTLNHAANGSNNFTVLTETTHYTLDKESGKVLLTSSGVTALGTNILYATYWYTDAFSDSVISSMITVSDDEIDLMTGRKWDTPTSVVEYRNGRPTLGYPTTDNPYAVDYDDPDGIILRNQPVTVINNIYFLASAQPISKFFNFDDGTSTYTDKTTEINSTTEAPFNLFDSSPATNDYVYIGGANIFLGLTTVLGTAGVDTGSTAIDWEYWDGSSWTDLTETDTDAGASIFTTSGKFTWTYPYGWATTTVNSISAYWVRGKLTNDYSTDPKVSTMTIHDSVNEVVELRNFSLRHNMVSFVNKEIPYGQNNVRIDYDYGETTTPSYINELSILMAAEMSFLNISGGSYDDATGYSVGSMEVQIGEAWVNVRNVLKEIRNKMDKIINLVGKRNNILSI